MNQCRVVRWTAESLEPVSILLGLINPIEHNDNGASGLIESEFLLDLTMGNKPFSGVKYNLVTKKYKVLPS